MRVLPNEIVADVISKTDDYYVDGFGNRRLPTENMAIVLAQWIGSGGEFYGRGSTGMYGKIIVKIGGGKCAIEVCDEVKPNE